MTQKQILYFEKAMETRNISLAAESLYVSRSVISRAIQELEEEFGVVLFERSKAGIEPTEAGNLLHGMVLQISGCFDALVTRFRHMEETSFQRTLCVGVTPTNNRVICRILYGPFLEAFPDICIRVYERYSHDLLELLNSGTVDVIISPVMEPNLQAMAHEDLYKVQIMMGMAADHPLARRESLSVLDLLDIPLGFLGNPIPAVEQIIQKAFSAQNARPNMMLQTSDLQVLQELTQKGQILSVLPDDMMRDWEGVVAVPMDFMSRKSVHRAYWSNAVPLNSAATDFLGFIVEYFRNQKDLKTERSADMPEETKEQTSQEPVREETLAPTLSESFFAELLGLPSCKTKGYCDNCGRCEH